MTNLSIIIPTLNEQNYIAKILEDIQQQSINPKEIIVVDGYSKDKTKMIIKNQFPEITLLSCPPNVSSQRNFGAKMATGKILLFLDADTRLPNNTFLARTIRQFSKADIACPFYLPFRSNFCIFAVYIFFNSMFFIFQKLSPSGAGSALLIKKNIFEKINGFNQNTRFEDIELIRRASKIARFKMLHSYLWVSDRRFKKYGTLRTTIQYLLLSFLFLGNQFNYSAGFSYQFGKYNKK